MSNTFDSPTFDPNAGRQEAYDKQWNSYLSNLSQTQNKINVKKARKYFDSQFEQDWNNSAWDREMDFTKQQQDQRWARLKENMANMTQQGIAENQKTMDSRAQINQQPVTQPTTPPTQPVRDKNGRTREEVLAIQNEMLSKGYDLGKYGADGIWGKDTQSAYDMYIQNGKNPYQGEVITSAQDEMFANNPNVGRDNRTINRNQQPKAPQKKSPVIKQEEPSFGDNYLGFSQWELPWLHYNSNDGIIPAIVKANLNNSKVILNDITKAGKDVTNFLGGILFNYKPFKKQGGNLKYYKNEEIIKQILKNSNVFPYNLQ